MSALPSEEIRFLVAIAPNGSRAHVEGSLDALAIHMARDVESGEWAAKTRPAIPSVIHFAPFSLLLADRSLVDAFPHVDCTDWLRSGVDDVAKVSVTFPVVDLPSTPDSPVLISMLHFIGSKT
ncbi:conserved hypothetical protein [Pseudoclavibacter sp. 8L]|nr:conserved hypothetical protein [Pseudoclavibacter sp. 8L]